MSETAKPELGRDDITIFAETNFRNQFRSFGIKRDDRRRHMYVIGKTGMGKTTLLENMIISDIINGEGCCYVDPHGDTAEKILNYIPAHRINDVIYLNPSDSEFPIAFNVLEAVDEKAKNFIASGLISVFKKLWADSWGPRLEYILRNTILALLDYPGSTLLGIMRILVDQEYRDKVIEKVTDPVVKSFWTNEYSKWNDRVLQEVISPIQNKVGQFLSNFLIRNIVGQVKSTIDLRDIMDNKKILIMNLSKGRIGEDTMQLLGSMIITKLYLAAMSRVNIPEKERADFYLYVDEFQNFATESFADILSEARKYRLNLIIAHQYIEQLPEEVAAAVFGNVGTLVCFRVGASDAELLVKEFTPFFIEDDLVNIPAFQIYLKLMIDGLSSDPFSANTLPPLFEDMFTDSSDRVVKVSRERYAHPRSVIEDKINRWSGMDLSDKVIEATGGEATKSGATSLRNQVVASARKIGSTSGENRAKSNKSSGEGGEKKEKERYPIVCSLCNRPSFIGFKHDETRPIFCDDCMKKVKEERRKKKEDRVMDLPLTEEVPDIARADLVQPVSLDEALSLGTTGFDGNKKPGVQAIAPRPPVALPQISEESLEIEDNGDNDNNDDDIDLEDQKLEWYEEAKKLLDRKNQ
ncbi:MAG: type IV secretion system DNA-binding domain-containing protein [Patescibacteria group bacterium]